MVINDGSAKSARRENATALPRTPLPDPNPDVIYKEVTGGAVLLSTKDEVYYGLNGVAAAVWERLPPVLNGLDELCADVSQLYPGVDSATIRADVPALLDDLLARGLVISRRATCD